MVLEIEVIIPPSVPLGWRGVRAERLMNHAGNQKFRYDVSIRVTQNHIVVHDLFAGKNHFLRSKGSLVHDSEVPPGVGVALLVCPLDMKDSHVGPDGANGQQRFVGKRTANRGKLTAAPKITTLDRPGWKKRQTRGRSLQSQADCKVGVLLNLDGLGNSRFRGATIIVAQPGGHIADPGGNNLFYATCADQLIK